jgi:uncharacterized membrane protein
LYAVTITILSVFFVIGGIMLSKLFFFFTKHFLSKERTCAKKDCNSFGKAFLSKKRFVLKEKQKSSTKNTPQVRAYLVILLVLIPYFFFCATGVAHQMFGVRNAIILNSEGKQYDLMYVHDQESYGAKWLKRCGESGTKLYAVDPYGGIRLTSQGNIPMSLIDVKSFKNNRTCNGYIFLRYYNSINGKLYYKSISYNLSEYSHLLVEKNKIYASGGSEIYK